MVRMANHMFPTASVAFTVMTLAEFGIRFRVPEKFPLASAVVPPVRVDPENTTFRNGSVVPDMRMLAPLEYPFPVVSVTRGLVLSRLRPVAW